MQRLERLLSLVIVVAAVAALSGCFLQSAPSAQFTTSPAFDYPPLDVTFNASSSSSPNGPIVNYDWDFGDGATADGVIVTHTYVDKGVYEVTLEVRDSTGETGVRTKSVEALNRVPNASFVEHASQVAADVVLEFDASASYDPDGRIVEYDWDFGDGWTDSGVLVEHSYPREKSIYTVTLSVFDDDDDSDTYSKKIEIGCCGGY